jgi:hypothetical protein
MKTRYRLTHRGSRGGMFYCVDTKTGKRRSLQTCDEDEARQIINAWNQAHRQPAVNLQIAQAYLQHGDPAMASRTWQHVMEQILSTKTGNTRERWQYAIQDKAFDLIRHHKLIETSAEHFLNVLNKGSVSTNVYLRRAHNFAMGMHWLPWPVLPKLHCRIARKTTCRPQICASNHGDRHAASWRSKMSAMVPDRDHIAQTIYSLEVA